MAPKPGSTKLTESTIPPHRARAQASSFASTGQWAADRRIHLPSPSAPTESTSDDSWQAFVTPSALSRVAFSDGGNWLILTKRGVSKDCSSAEPSPLNTVSPTVAVGASDAKRRTVERKEE